MIPQQPRIKVLDNFGALAIVNRAQDGIKMPSPWHSVWKSNLSLSPDGANLWSIQQTTYDPVQPGHTGPAGRIGDPLRDLVGTTDGKGAA